MVVVQSSQQTRNSTSLIITVACKLQVITLAFFFTLWLGQCNTWGYGFVRFTDSNESLI